MRAHEYAVDVSWQPVLKDLGVRPANVLRRAGLPEDLLKKAGASLPAESYYRFWLALEAELADPAFPLKLGRSLTTESFSPPLFAALCSRNLLAALERIREYKPLVAPIQLQIEDRRDSVTLTLEWQDAGLPPPSSLVMAELVFFVRLARLATREAIRPLQVTTNQLPQPAAAYQKFFGVRTHQGETHSLRFSRVDSLRPFLTSNDGMWKAFEPELRRRLADLDETATLRRRVRAVLLESLPSGEASMESVAHKLALSGRTLQRGLSSEGTRFQQVLRDTREALARHYLERTTIRGTEISFLLGFVEPNSFYRAFGQWTGKTPEAVRQRARRPHRD